MERNGEVAAEFSEEVAGVDSTLSVVEDRLISQREDRLVPDPGVSRHIERPEVGGGHVVTGRGDQGDEPGAIPGEEELPAVGMVIGLVGQDAIGDVVPVVVIAVEWAASSAIRSASAA